jgi:nucleotide-binding universal stress UspA family protein
LGETGIEITYETLLGEPYRELIHSVQQEQYDLVVAGTRGIGGIKRLILGSTAKQLVRKCPASVWIVKNKEPQPPKSILAAVDMSDVSQQALNQAIWTARQAGAELHILHVIEPLGLSTELLDRQAVGAKSLRELIETEVSAQFKQFLLPVEQVGVAAKRHVLWGSPTEATLDTAERLRSDLVVLGAVGRRGIKGLLLGNTAEGVLTHCDCDVLTVKPADFVSPIQPASWQLHPGPNRSQ